MSSAALVLLREEVNQRDVKMFQRLGFTLNTSNDSTYNVNLPKGWNIISNQNASIIVDAKKRKRALSYIGFSSKNDEVKFLTKYNVSSKRIANDRFSPILVYVSDSDGNLIKSIDLCGTYDSEDYNQLVVQGEKYLDEKFPDWRNPDMYWD